LSESYAKAAFLALKAIERDTNDRLGEKATQEAIDTADSEAHSKAEKETTVNLQKVFYYHVGNNVSKNILKQQQQLVNNSNPQLKAIYDRENACFTPFEESLREREDTFPPACLVMREESNKKPTT
jgi:hypothetical protein